MQKQAGLYEFARGMGRAGRKGGITPATGDWQPSHKKNKKF